MLAAKKKESGWQAFLRQYRDVMQLVLLGAAVVNQIFTQEISTTLVLVALTVFNAVLGMNQEAKAEASLAALQHMMKNVARVRRDGQAVEVDASELVPGDVVLVEAGNRIPADGRLFVAATLEIEEAALTGESVASPKTTDATAAGDVPLGDRHCMAFMNTAVTRGRGEFIVTGTGMDTEMGRIADLLNRTEADKTPLQKQLDRLTVIIAGLAGLAFVVMLVLGLRNDQDFDEVFLAGVALAISAIPTGMPAVVTTLYAMGTRVLAGHNAIVKRLPSVETLGSVSAICSDKTGTLTLNKMTAREFTVPGYNHYTVKGEGYSTQGQLLHDGGKSIPARRRHAADGAVRRRASRRRSADRRPDRGRAHRAGRKGRDRRRRRPRALPAHRRGAVRLRVQVHGDLPRDDGRTGPAGRALLRQRRARRPHRPRRLRMDAR